ncbi:D-alanyl-D-alanine carboxypeptidase/D-alanyl-D-alanine-endopeptidase [Nocardioides ferulae]|uniref:D-alanyl-D-alanine carboxypeptidase/D-alanyl-D-alanine endopeptidase n=1 Tax=Nocardioides ferulae TaxID=2340821 RepID=UPI0013DDBD28|nr:D-alanyl-D-alanine carboxypeptidase/D-alanyl-D-alanine-endopeptidase [Nocardioides ferulae]
MARSDLRHTSSPAWRRRLAAVVLVLAMVAATVVVWPDWWRDRWDGWFGEQPPAGPAAIPPPPGLELPRLARPAPVAAPVDPDTAGALSRARVRRALAPYLDDPDLGRHVVAAVAPLGEGAPVLTRGDTVVPASTTKLVTATAALLALGPDHVFETRVVRAGRNGVVLVGGGDPFLAAAPTPRGEPAAYPPRADVATLARETARALRGDGVRRVRVGYDDTLFTGPTASPEWEPGYVPDGVVSPITALWLDEGRDPSGYGRVADPSAAAAERFAAALADAGIRVTGAPGPASARAGGAELAVVESAPLWQIVEQVILVSDNEASEVLAHHVGLAEAGEGSFAAGRTAIEQVLTRAGVDFAGSLLHDGSGLSRGNRIHWRLLVDVLRLAASDEHPELRSVLTGLPVAAFTGSLSERFADGPAAGRGRVRAKTGTLSGVSSLAGIATDLDGVPMVFVLAADKVRLEDTLDARDALDAAAAALGACSCAAPGGARS